MLIKKKRKEYILFILLLIIIPFLPGVRGGYCATFANEGSCESAGCTWVPGACSGYSSCRAVCTACPMCTWVVSPWGSYCTGSISCPSVSGSTCQSCGCTWTPSHCTGEDGSFTWYSSGGSTCKTTLVGIKLLQANIYNIQTYYSTFDTSCCDKIGGWITVKFCGAGSCSNKIDTEKVVCLPGSTRCSDSWLQTCQSCKSWQDYQNCDLSDGCSGTKYRDYSCSGGSCIYDTPDQDISQTYCNCLGTGLWGIGGEVAQEDCCGDDSGEYKKTRSCASWCTSSSSDDACCNAGNKCVLEDECYLSNSGSDSCALHLDEAYCAAGVWDDTDHAADYCTACVGTGYWDLDGEYESKKPSCCEDDIEEYKIVVGKGNETKNGACCDDKDDCMTMSGHCQSEYLTGERSCDLDGIDNDCDGKTDCSDTDCTSKNVCLGCDPENCTNAEDDDCDYLVDCMDSDCIGGEGCEHCVLEICDNDFDDDCDLKKDCEDPDCTGFSPCEVCVTEECTNKMDDDCDSFIDYADWDCECPVGTTLCEDYTCSAQCETPQGCIDKNGVCEEGEGCDCEDCENERGPCDTVMVCDPFFKTCGCPTGTTLCDDGYCRRACGECGDGKIDPGEECDNDKFSSTPVPVFNETDECKEIDEFTGGDLGCDDACFLNTSNCGGSKGVCGDGNINVGETCDGVNYTGNCSNFGFELGVLSCLAAGELGECHFDTSGCYTPIAACNNNGICEVGIGEDCTCPDCLGEQATCSFGATCDEAAMCVCKDGTTLCADGSCRSLLDCDAPADCVINGKCEFGEGCDCEDCINERGPCKTGSVCLNNECTSCSILNAYWTEDCIGCQVADGVSMVVEGTSGCTNETVTYDIWKDTFLGDENVGDPSPPRAVFDSGKAKLNWTPIAEGDYYFIASIRGEEFYSTNLEVRACDPTCDSDCDGKCDPGKTSANCTIVPSTGTCDESDENSETAWCESVNKYGLGPGQATCAAHYNCMLGWWDPTIPTVWNEDMKNAAMIALEWSECDEATMTRKRTICPSTGDCCTAQGNCYCEFPVDMPHCALSQFKPATEKACLAEEKFPFFTNMNILIVVLILIGFYIWKTREKKTKKKTRTKK